VLSRRVTRPTRATTNELAKRILACPTGLEIATDRLADERRCGATLRDGAPPQTAVCSFLEIDLCPSDGAQCTSLRADVYIAPECGDIAG
jgi:hypothetical protein